MQGEIEIRDGAIIADPGESGLAVAQAIARELGLSHLTIVQPGVEGFSERTQHGYEPDTRLLDNPNAPISRFGPRSRRLTDAEKTLQDKLNGTATVLEVLIETIPRGRYQVLALTALEQAIFWAIRGLTQ
jgi:hypothetical protein